MFRFKIATKTKRYVTDIEAISKRGEKYLRVLTKSCVKVDPTLAHLRETYVIWFI